MSKVLVIAAFFIPALSAAQVPEFLAAPIPPLFTASEIKAHTERIETITSVATRCLVDTYSDHVQFYSRWHISKYYGNRKPQHRTEALRRAELRKYGAPEHLITQLEPISCIGLTVNCLEKGFQAAKLDITWNKIYRQLADQNRFLGTELQTMLIQLGWRSYYWNPDPSQNAAWDLDDQKILPLKPGRKWMPAWGGHAAHYSTVLRTGTYVSIPVLDAKTLVGFGAAKPPALARIPFFVGTAHAGYHVFPGFAGNVIEAHSTRDLNDFKNLEVSEFNPLAGGGPKWTRSEHYRSGVIVLPPVSPAKVSDLQGLDLQGLDLQGSDLHDGTGEE